MTVENDTTPFRRAGWKGSEKRPNHVHSKPGVQMLPGLPSRNTKRLAGLCRVRLPSGKPVTGLMLSGVSTPVAEPM
jgi:hypothetical protein